MNRIKEERVLAGISPEELADKVNVALGTLNNWEGERYAPGQPRIDIMCKIFQVPEEYLMGKDEELLLELYRNFPREAKIAAINLIKALSSQD